MAGGAGEQAADMPDSGLRESRCAINGVSSLTNETRTRVRNTATPSGARTWHQRALLY